MSLLELLPGAAERGRAHAPAPELSRREAVAHRLGAQRAVESDCALTRGFRAILRELQKLMDWMALQRMHKAEVKAALDEDAVYRQRLVLI